MPKAFNELSGVSPRPDTSGLMMVYAVLVLLFGPPSFSRAHPCSRCRFDRRRIRALLLTGNRPHHTGLDLGILMLMGIVTKCHHAGGIRGRNLSAKASAGLSDHLTPGMKRARPDHHDHDRELSPGMMPSAPPPSAMAASSGRPMRSAVIGGLFCSRRAVAGVRAGEFIVMDEASAR